MVDWHEGVFGLTLVHREDDDRFAAFRFAADGGAVLALVDEGYRLGRVRDPEGT